MTLKELLSEKGMYLNESTMLTTSDLKHLGNYDGESHGELMSILEDFYNSYANQIYEMKVDLFEQFMEDKVNESNGLN